MRRWKSFAGCAALGLALAGLLPLPGCDGTTSAGQAFPADSSTAAAVPPQHTAIEAGRPLRSHSLPDYFPNDYDIVANNGYSYLEVPGTDGAVSELHIFSGNGNARHKVVFLREKGRLHRQLEFTFGSENDNMLEKEYVWQGDTATWTLSDRNREVMIVDSLGRIVERTLGILAVPYAYLHLDYDAQGRAARVDRFFKTDSTYEVVQTLYDYNDKDADWRMRTARIYERSFSPGKFRDWKTLKKFILDPAFEMGPFATKDPYRKVRESRVLE